MADLFSHEFVPSPEFDQFWAQYPRKIAKEAARKAFIKIRKKNSLAAILNMLATRKVDWAKRDMCYIPHASSWLRAEEFCEVDEPSVLSVPEISPSWNGTQAVLEKHLGSDIFASWLGPQEFIHGSPPKILCGTKFQANWIKSHFMTKLERALGAEPEIGVK